MQDLREILQRMRAQLTERIDRVQRDLARADAPLSADAPDRALQLENDEVLEGIGVSSSEELARIEAALARLDAGWQFTCALCGKPVSPARLKAVPYTNRCAACATRTD
jgi:DnaK suppressor protein